MKRIIYPLFPLVLGTLACSVFSTPPPPPREQAPAATEAAPAQPEEQQPDSSAPLPAQPAEEGASPAMASCQAWIQENHSLDYTNHGCNDQADVLYNVAKINGGVIPVGDNRFFIVWFPEEWEQLSDREVVFTIHGNGGCVEKNFDWWQESAQEHNFAVVALQYAEEDVADEDDVEDHLFDEANIVYTNLTTAFDEIQAHCSLGDAPVVFHGFSRGSALSYHLALLDRAPEGRKLFSTFIADSGGTGPAGTGDTPPGYLKDASDEAYAGAHFWLYCGMRDYDGVRCEDMEKAQLHILEHGGVVDELYVNPKGGHGIFISEDTQQHRRVLEDLFSYVDALPK